jgi:hypothetical protein
VKAATALALLVGIVAAGVGPVAAASPTTTTQSERKADRGCGDELAYLVRLSSNSEAGSSAHWRLREEIDRIVFS